MALAAVVSLVATKKQIQNAHADGGGDQASPAGNGHGMKRHQFDEYPAGALEDGGRKEHQHGQSLFVCFSHALLPSLKWEMLVQAKAATMLKPDA